MIGENTRLRNSSCNVMLETMRIFEVNIASFKLTEIDEPMYV